MSGPAFPKVLILSTTKISSVTATGSAKRNLFGGWNRDRLAQVHTAGGEADETLCTRFFHLERDDVTAKGALSRKLDDFITKFAPDVVYYRTIDDPASLSYLARALQQRGIPIVTHTMDDWLNRMKLSAFTKEEESRAAEAEAHLRETIDQAKTNLAISDAMSESMAKHYGTPFETFHNAIDFDEWSSVKRTRSFETDGVFRIRYTGSLAADMSRTSALDLAHVVDVLADERRPIRLEFSSAPWWQEVFNMEFREFHRSHHVGFLDRPDYLQFLADADLAVIPINFDDSSIAYLRHSMSNKAPEYMAAGLPVLCFGPLASATINYASTAGWGHCVTEQSANKLGQAIRYLMDDADERARLGEASAAIGRERHSAEENRRRFRIALGMS